MNFAMFTIRKKIGQKRIGELKTKNGKINTPFFMSIATKGAVKNIATDELEKIGAEIVLGNTYHLWLRPGDKLISKLGGLHKFMSWNGPILTDSGGFQIFSLGERAKGKFGTSGVRISEKGAEFIDPVNGSSHFMTPEKSIDIQLNLGSDIIMVLDECPSYPVSFEKAKRSMELTTRWAKRCFQHFHRRISESKDKYKQGRPLIFCIVQGSVFEELRKESIKQLSNLDFPSLGGPESGWDGYAIGGVAVGEPRDKMYEILEWVLPLIPEGKPRYLMGLGRPQEIVRAVNSGIDMFDCVIPTREGRHGRLFVWENGSSGDLSGEFYKTINISNEKHREEKVPIDVNCDCYACSKYSRSYLRHLFKIGEPLGMRLAALHNLRFYLKMMQILQEK